jgi:DNA invertase Pin-like site-specific DNA recombinase
LEPIIWLRSQCPRLSFIARILDEGLSLCCAEMPNASEFQLHIFAALAQEERRLISERTRAALGEAKKRGVKLGVNGSRLAIVNERLANEFAETIRNMIFAAGGKASYSEIARRLNDRGIRTRTGRLFHAQTVKNAAIRLKRLEDARQALL